MISAIEKLELEVTQFLIDLDATVDLLRKRYHAGGSMSRVVAVLCNYNIRNRVINTD